VEIADREMLAWKYRGLAPRDILTRGLRTGRRIFDFLVSDYQVSYNCLALELAFGEVCDLDRMERCDDRINPPRVPA
jgi:hypothetical protein